MQNQRTILLLAIATLVVGLAAFVMRQPSAPVPKEGEALLPELLAHINDVTEIAGRTQSVTFTLVRDGVRWVVKDKHSYPADRAKVQQLLLGITQLRRVEPKTRNPQLYAEIGVESVAHEGAKSLEFTLKDAKGKAVAALIVGERRGSRGDPALNEYFVRLPDDPQAWLVEGRLPDDKSVIHWLDRDIFKLDAARVRAVHVAHPDGNKLGVQRSDPQKSDYELAGLPTGAQIESPYAVNNIANALTDLTFDDVRPAAGDGLKGKRGIAVELTTFDGLRVRMQTSKDGDMNLAQLSAAFEPALTLKTPTAEKAAAAHEKISAEQSKLKLPEAVKQEVERLNERWQGWVYVLPQYRVDSLAKKRSELIKQGGGEAGKTPRG